MMNNKEQIESELESKSTDTSDLMEVDTENGIRVKQAPVPVTQLLSLSKEILVKSVSFLTNEELWKYYTLSRHFFSIVLNVVSLQVTGSVIEGRNDDRLAILLSHDYIKLLKTEGNAEIWKALFTTSVLPHFFRASSQSFPNTKDLLTKKVSHLFKTHHIQESLINDIIKLITDYSSTASFSCALAQESAMSVRLNHHLFTRHMSKIGHYIFTEKEQLEAKRDEIKLELFKNSSKAFYNISQLSLRCWSILDRAIKEDKINEWSSQPLKLVKFDEIDCVFDILSQLLRADERCHSRIIFNQATTNKISSEQYELMLNYFNDCANQDELLPKANVLLAKFFDFYTQMNVLTYYKKMYALRLSNSHELTIHFNNSSSTLVTNQVNMGALSDSELLSILLIRLYQQLTTSTTDRKKLLDHPESNFRYVLLLLQLQRVLRNNLRKILEISTTHVVDYKRTLYLNLRHTLSLGQFNRLDEGVHLSALSHADLRTKVRTELKPEVEAKITEVDITIVQVLQSIKDKTHPSFDNNYILAHMYVKVSQHKLAYALFEKCASSGSASAASYVVAYCLGLVSNSDVPVDYMKAIHWLNLLRNNELSKLEIDVFLPLDTKQDYPNSFKYMLLLIFAYACKQQWYEVERYSEILAEYLMTYKAIHAVFYDFNDVFNNLHCEKIGKETKYKLLNIYIQYAFPYKGKELLPKINLDSQPLISFLNNIGINKASDRNKFIMELMNEHLLQSIHNKKLTKQDLKNRNCKLDQTVYTNYLKPWYNIVLLCQQANCIEGWRLLHDQAIPKIACLFKLSTSLGGTRFANAREKEIKMLEIIFKRIERIDWSHNIEYKKTDADPPPFINEKDRAKLVTTFRHFLKTTNKILIKLDPILRLCDIYFILNKSNKDEKLRDHVKTMLFIPLSSQATISKNNTLNDYFLLATKAFILLKEYREHSLPVKQSDCDTLDKFINSAGKEKRVNRRSKRKSNDTHVEPKTTLMPEKWRILLKQLTQFKEEVLSSENKDKDKRIDDNLMSDMSEYEAPVQNNGLMVFTDFDDNNGSAMCDDVTVTKPEIDQYCSAFLPDTNSMPYRNFNPNEFPQFLSNNTSSTISKNPLALSTVTSHVLKSEEKKSKEEDKFDVSMFFRNDNDDLSSRYDIQSTQFSPTWLNTTENTCAAGGSSSSSPPSKKVKLS